MSSDMQLPTLAELLMAFEAEVGAVRRNADVRRGAVYDLMAGVGAMLWLRQASRTKDLFRICYFSTAADTDLDERITTFGGPERIQATRGSGLAVVRRPTAAAGTGTLWAGTRMAVTGIGRMVPVWYRVSQNTIVAPTALAMQVPIEAAEIGAGTAIDTPSLGMGRLTWEDIVFDPTLQPESIVCADGTSRETDQEYLSRYRQQRMDQRMGYAQAITDACVAVGAANVALFESDFILPDTGINRCFVADSAYSTSTELLRACRIAVDSARVLGCDMTVWGITRQQVSLELTLQLWTDPGEFNQDAVKEEARQAVLRYFDGNANPYVFRFDALRGEVQRSIPAMQDLQMTSGPADTVIANILTATELQRLYTTREAIQVALQGP